MSAQEKKFTRAEICEMLMKTRPDDFGKFMCDAIRAGFDGEEMRRAFEANMASNLLIFVSFTPRENRAALARRMAADILDFVLREADDFEEALTRHIAAQVDQKAGGDA